MDITRRKKDLEEYFPVSKMSTLNRHRQAIMYWTSPKGGVPTCSYMVVWKYSVQGNNLATLGWTIIVGCIEKFEKRRKDNLDAVTGVNYGVDASFSSCCKCICGPQTGIMRIRGPLKTIASFRRWTHWTGSKQASWHLYLPTMASP